MKLNWIQFRNRKIGAWTTPQFTDIEPEIAAVQLSRALQMNDKADVDKTYDPLVMFLFGTFDDESGELKLLEEPKMLLICGDVIRARKEANNGTEKSC